MRVIGELLYAHVLISMGGLIGSSVVRRVNKVQGSSKLIRCHDDMNLNVMQTLLGGCWKGWNWTNNDATASRYHIECDSKVLKEGTVYNTSVVVIVHICEKSTYYTFNVPKSKFSKRTKLINKKDRK